MEAKTKINEEALGQEFAESADLKGEFGGDVKSYIGFKLAEAQGRVQTCRSGSCSMTSVEQFNDSVQLEELSGKLEANEAELKRLSSLQNKIAEAEKAEVEACGVACGVDGLPLEE